MRALGFVGKWLLKASVALALTSSGCAFLLDFDQFEACSDCAAIDACVTPNHACIERGCTTPRSEDECSGPETSSDETTTAALLRCSDESAVLSPYLEFEPVMADVILQSEVLTTSTRIYHAVYVSNGGQRDVVLRAFDTTGEEVGAPGTYRAPLAVLSLSELLLAKKADVGPDASVSNSPEIVAPVSMVPTRDVLDGLTLYAALAPAGAATADVVRVDLGATWPEHATPTWLTEIPNFLVDENAGRSGPAAGVLTNGEPFVVWQGCKPDPDLPNISLETNLCNTTGVTAVYGHTGSQLLDIDALARQGTLEALRASSLQALSGGTQPAAVWAVSPLENDPPVYVKTGVPAAEGNVSTELPQCDDPVGGAKWLSAASIKGPVSSVVWTKGNTTAEATRVQCLDETCLDMALRHVDAGVTLECSATSRRERVVTQVDYLVHGVWAESTADSKAYTLAAFTKAGDKAHVFTTATRGEPNPNKQAVVGSGMAFEFNTSNPTKLVLSVQKHAPKAKRAVVAVSWAEAGKGAKQAARLSALDLCLPP